MRVYMDFGRGKVGIDEILIKAARRKGQKKMFMLISTMGNWLDEFLAVKTVKVFGSF